MLFTYLLGTQNMKIYKSRYVDKGIGMISFKLTIKLEAKFVLQIVALLAHLESAYIQGGGLLDTVRTLLVSDGKDSQEEGRTLSVWLQTASARVQELEARQAVILNGRGNPLQERQQFINPPLAF